MKQSNSRKLPVWLRKKLSPAGPMESMNLMLRELGLHTVCSGAHCPNQGECFSRGTATFMILGNLCTRDCRFCAVGQGDPGSPDPEEPEAVAEAAFRLHLRHVVITSVTRDDLPDGGAGHFAATIRAIRKRLPDSVIEVLVPDFQGSIQALGTVLDEQPDILNHNVETVPRLYPTVRPEADYSRSLRVLAAVGNLGFSGTIHPKSGLMLGLGERPEEVRAVLKDLRNSGCNILTMGQYLAPSGDHIPVERYLSPEEFEKWRKDALEMGFRAVASGPFVRSSYLADVVFESISEQKKEN